MVLDLLIYKVIRRQQECRRNREYVIFYQPSSRIETWLSHHPILLKHLHTLKNSVVTSTQVTPSNVLRKIAVGVFGFVVSLKRTVISPKCRCGTRKEWSSGMGWKCPGHNENGDTQ